MANGPCPASNGMKLDIPFYSQHTLDVPEEWRRRACGVLTLRMALAYLLAHKGRPVPSTEQLIHEAEAIHGWTEDGIDHEALIRLAHNYGIPAYREEFRSVSVDPEHNSFEPSEYSTEMLEYGIGRIYEAVKNGQVVLASVPRTLTEGGTPHAVVIVGFEEGETPGFYYHDPDYDTADEGAFRFIDVESFKALWRRFMRVIGPVASIV